ncbi:uncharacterized protein LY79DRAFT_362154 [Colletotrichum navitas]|uniref:Uncharacterized protein n=1 Tax=Colletotrichum navitas TaxID=681940 RepID=A0AAD8PR19_9PEZI|nr:uncharacterized protein LY79DRAFT_362154 [Colletotrichum navitas]KAK1574682.1 hypothetical protein LY79DRAFT_362154 [Colletotrichum navitas]
MAFRVAPITTTTHQRWKLGFRGSLRPREETTHETRRRSRERAMAFLVRSFRTSTTPTKPEPQQGRCTGKWGGGRQRQSTRDNLWRTGSVKQDGRWRSPIYPVRSHGVNRAAATNGAVPAPVAPNPPPPLNKEPQDYSFPVCPSLDKLTNCTARFATWVEPGLKRRPTPQRRRFQIQHVPCA